MSRTPWASIARIEVDGIHSGTGFLVSGNLVVTALHVVADKLTGRPFPRIRLHFNVGAEFDHLNGVFQTDATIKNDLQSIDHDFVILECAKIPPCATPLRLSDRARPFDPCICPGFANQDPSGFTAIGEISSLNDPMPNGRAALGVQLKLGSGVVMKGHSGAPLFVRDRVVGLLRTAFLDDDERSSGGIVHATASQHIVEVCNRLSPDLLACRVSVRWPAVAGPHPLLLADRKTEFELFQEMITGRTRERILLVQGPSGSGKSTLMRELAVFGDPLGLLVGVADFKGGLPLSEIILSLLMSLPETLLPATRASEGAQQFSVMLDELADMERPIILMFDNWQDSGEDVRRWIINKVLPAVPTTPSLIVVIGGQNVQDVRKQLRPESTRFSELQPITSTDDWHDYSRRKWPKAALTRDHIQAVTFAGNGLPHIIDQTLEAFQTRLSQDVSLGGAS
jgi:hypothetical protein